MSRISFRAKGMSMFPTVQPGDILHIAWKNIEKIKIGDILVYRNGKFLIGHRVVSSNLIKGEKTFSAWGDCSDKIDPFVVRERDLIGVVEKVERNGKFLPVEMRGSPAVRRMLRLFGKLHFLGKLILFEVAGRILERIQNNIICRNIVQFLFSTKIFEISFEIRIPFGKQFGRDERPARPRRYNSVARGRATLPFFRKIPESEFSLQTLDSLRSYGNNGKLVLKINGSDAASLSFFLLDLNPASIIQSKNIFVRRRFRNFDLEKRLVLKFGEIVSS